MSAWLRITVATLACVLSICVAFFAGQPSAGGQVLGSGVVPHQATGGRYAVVIVIDAARADEVDLSRLPNLAALAARGTVFPEAWVGQIPSITEASHATIGTGVFPSRHGIYGEIWRVPGTEQMSPDMLDGVITRTGYIGKAIQRTGVPTLAGIVKQHDPGAIVAAISGHKIYAADGMGGGAADIVAFGSTDGRGHFVPSAIPGRAPAQSVLGDPSLDLPSYPRVPGVEDAWVGRLASGLVKTYLPRVLLINLPEVDTFGHADGIKPSVMQPLMEKVDATIGTIEDAYQKAGILDQTDWIVTADHGMVPAVSTVQSTTVRAIAGKAGGNVLYLSHGDYCTLWLRNPSAASTVARALTRAHLSHVAAIYQRKADGAFRLVSPTSWLADPAVAKTYADLLKTEDQAQAPDIVMMFDENTITMTPNLLRINRQGDHAGATWGAQHIPFIMAGPGIREKYVSAYPARLVDVAPTIETLLGAVPQRQDGVPLADAMTDPGDSVLSAQKAIWNRQVSDVQALIEEASLRPNLGSRAAR